MNSVSILWNWSVFLTLNYKETKCNNIEDQRPIEYHVEKEEKPSEKYEIFFYGSARTFLTLYHKENVFPLNS